MAKVVIEASGRFTSKVAPSGDGPHDGDMEARVTRLETDVGKIREDVATIKERLSHMPMKADLWKAVAVGGGIAIGGLWALLMFFAKPWVEQLVAGLTKAHGP